MKAFAPLSLDGPGIEPWVALLLGDYSPAEYLKRVAAFNTGTLPSANFYAPMREAEECFRQASLCGPEQIEASLELMGRGKVRLRDAVDMFLEGRSCECCIALRERLRCSVQ